MDSMLKGLFGGGNDDDEDGGRRGARDFVDRFEQGPIDQGYSDDEAMRNFDHVSRNASPEQMERAAQQAFSRMDPQQRQQFAQMMQQRMGGQGGGSVSADPRQLSGMVSQMHRQDPGGLASLFGGGGNDRRDNDGGGGGGIGGMLGGLSGAIPGGTLGKVAMGGIAAYAMKELLGGGGDDDDKKKRRSV